MTTHTIAVARKPRPHWAELTEGGLQFIVPVARVLFAAIFVMAAANHFTRQTIAYASDHGVPWAAVMVPVSGVMGLVGGLSVALGFRAKMGAWLLVLFLIPVTLTMHNFWAVSDPMMARLQQAMFMKNLSILGGALMIAYFGAGPVSLDAHDVFPRRSDGP